MNHRWSVSLDGDRIDLRLLVGACKEGPVQITETDGAFYLAADAFEAETDHEAVRAKAEGLLTVLNGISRLVFNSEKRMRVHTLYGTAHGGGRAVYVAIEDCLRLCSAPSVSVTKAGGSIEQTHAGDPVRGWLELANHDAEVAWALRLIATQPSDWVGLYRLLEVVVVDTGGGWNELVHKGWASKNTLNLFKQTANSRRAVGEFARHAGSEYGSPARPMSLSEARALVHGIVRRWIASK